MKKIDAVEIVRRIRDKQNEETSGKSPKEIIEYYRRKAKQIEKMLTVEQPNER